MTVPNAAVTVVAAPAGCAIRTVVIAAPPATVFAFLADPRQHLVIDGSATLQRNIDGPQRLSLGATFGVRVRRGVSYNVLNKVVEFEENRRIAWRHSGGHTWRYVLEPETAGIRVTETFDGTTAKAPWLLRLMRVAKKNAVGMTKTLERLKQLAEAQTDADPAKTPSSRL